MEGLPEAGLADDGWESDERHRRGAIGYNTQRTHLGASQSVDLNSYYLRDAEEKSPMEGFGSGKVAKPYRLAPACLANHGKESRVPSGLQGGTTCNART